MMAGKTNLLLLARNLITTATTRNALNN